MSLLLSASLDEPWERSRTRLEALGFVVEFVNEGDGVVTGTVPVARLRELARLEEVMALVIEQVGPLGPGSS